MSQILQIENVELNKSFATKEEAIVAAGEILRKQGYVSKKYIDSMLEREKLVSVYIGNHVAIPHGEGNSQKEIISSGISVIQVPQGVSFGEGMTAYMIFGIAGKDNSHLEILGNIAVLCSEEENVMKLRNAKTKQEIFDFLSENIEY